MEEETQQIGDSSLLARAEQAEAEAAALRARVAALEAAPTQQKSGGPTELDKHKTSILRLIFMGIAVLMGYLGVLVLVNWLIPGSSDADGIGSGFFQTSKDILLVLTGILGSAMANVFDSKSKGE